MANTLTLTKSASTPSRAVIFVDYAGPLFFGGGDVSYVCPHCNKSIANLVRPDAIWDLVVECGYCRGVSEFPRLPTGTQALGYVYVPRGRYRITGAIDISNGRALIGEGAITGGGTTFRKEGRTPPLSQPEAADRVRRPRRGEELLRVRSPGRLGYRTRPARPGKRHPVDARCLIARRRPQAVS